MTEKGKNNANGQNGEIMLEAAIVFVPVIILLIVLLSLSFMFYQQSLITSAATEIAADTAKNYKFPDLGLNNTGNIISAKQPALTNVNSASLYRMTFGMGKITNKHKSRAKTFAENRVALSTLGINSDDVQVKCEIKTSSIGRAYVKVKVSQKTDFFLSGIFELAGASEDGTLFSSTAYAECDDLMEYTSLVNFTQYEAKKFGLFNPIAKLYNATDGLFKSIKDFASKLTN